MLILKPEKVISCPYPQAFNFVDKNIDSFVISDRNSNFKNWKGKEGNDRLEIGALWEKVKFNNEVDSDVLFFCWFPTKYFF